MIGSIALSHSWYAAVYPGALLRARPGTCLSQAGKPPPVASALM